MDDPTPGGNANASTAIKGAPTITDTTLPANDPWANYLEQEKGYEQQAKVQKLTVAAKAAEVTADTPQSASVGDVVKGLPGAVGSILTNNPVNTAFNVAYGLGKGLLHLADIVPAFANYMAKVEGKPESMQTPLPGQSLINWIDPQLPSYVTGKTPNNPDSGNVSEALQEGAATDLDYEAGGEAVKATGLGPIVSKILGNVVGGQANAPFSDSAGDRAKQAAFDAAFGTADVAVGAAAKSLKASRAATEAVTQAKNGVMSSAIDAFEKADSPNYNPEVAGQLRTMLDSKTFDKPTNMVDFEKNLQTTLGDNFYKPEVNSVLQPIIDAGHEQVATTLGQKGIKPENPGPLRPQDVFDTDVANTKAEANETPTKPPEVQYVPKDNLGKDPAGNKKMATTQVDTKTGNALVYYDKSLDANPSAKQVILDHEMGHILDKRLNGGNNISAEIVNPDKNAVNLQKVLGDFSRENGKSVSETAAALSRDMEALGGGDGKAPNETFADAVATYRIDPKEAATIAPTFAKLMEYVPQEGRYTEHSTSLEGLKQDSPIAGKAVEDGLKTAKNEARAKAAKEKLNATSKPSKTSGGKVGSTGLDTGARKSGELSFNPEKINAPEDVEKLFNKMDAENASFSSQRMAKDNEQIKDLARLTGLTEADLVKTRPGSIANAETLTAARQLVLNKAQALADRLKGIDIPNASDAELKGIKDDYTRLVAMQQAVAGLRTEAANTLRSLQLQISPEENFTLKDAFTKLQAAGIASKGDAGIFAAKVGKDLQTTMSGRVVQGALKTWYAAILSGPATPARHFIGVASNLVADISSKAFNPATFKEVVPAITAMFKSVPDAYKVFKETFKDGAKVGDFNELADPKEQPTFTGKMAGYGKTVELVGRTMDALASGYSKVAHDVEETSLKVNSASMSEDVQKALSSAYADQINYFGEPKGYISQKVLAGAKALTSGSYNPLKLLIPFTRIVTNILDRQFDYLPGTSAVRAFDIDGGLTRQTDNLMTKYGLTSDADRMAVFARLKNQQIGRMVLGMGVTAGAAELAAQGLVSGNGPADYNQKLQLERTGWRPNSVQIGGYWVPHIWFGPLGGIFSAVGNISDAGKYDKGVAAGDYGAMLSKGLLGWGQSQLSNSFLSGVSNLLGALSDPTKAATYLKTFGSELIPVPKAVTGTISIAKGIDADVTGDPTADQQYATKTIIDKIRAELGLTGDLGAVGGALQPSLNQFGEPMRADTIYGITPTLSKADAVDNYLQANDIVVTLPDANTQYTDPATGGKIALTPTQYTAYVKESGQEIYQQLEDMIPNLQNEDIDSQRTQIHAMIDQVRTEARQDVMSQ